MNKNLLLVSNFLKEYRIFRYFLFLTLILLIFGAHFETRIIIEAVNFLKIVRNNGSIEIGTSLIISRLSKMFFLYTLSFILPLISDFYLTKLYRICICFYITKALNLDHMLYNEIGSGYIRGVIDRKAFNYVFGMDMLLYQTLQGSFTYLFMIFLIYYYFHVKILIYTLFNLLLCIILNLPTLKKRNKLRKKYSTQKSLLISRILQIVSNFIAIKANNTEDEEINDLNFCFNLVEKYGIYVSWFNYLGALIVKISVIVPNAIFFYCVMNNKINYISSGTDFILYNTLFVALKSKTSSLRDQITGLSMFWTDITSDDWDELKLDIENIEMYYNYKISDEKAIINKNKFAILPENFENNCYSDYNIIKNTVIETNKLKTSNEQNDVKKFVFTKCIEFKDFSLSIKDKILIRPSNFQIYKGDKIAIIGKNGAGKSSFMNIFLRYREYYGEIFVDGVNMKHIDKIDQRDKISFIPQTPGILSGTIRENIIYQTNNGDVNDLCSKYDMHFENLDKDVGESMLKISGGQMQKISFLRGVMKDGDLFLLDEPTASMDPNATLNLINKIHTCLKNKTVIAIIHNMNLIKNFDKFLILKDNRLSVYSSYEKAIEIIDN